MRRSNTLASQELGKLYDSKVLKLTDEEAIEKFLRAKQLENVKQRTIITYQNIFKVVARDKPLAKVDKPFIQWTAEDVEALLYYWKEETPVSVVTINGRIKNLKTFFTFLYKRNFTTVDLFQEVKKMREPVIIKDTLDTSEISKIVNYFKRQQTFSAYRNMVIFQLMLDCGTRIGETLSIKVNDLDFQNETLRIAEPKGLKQREVFPSEQMLVALQTYLEIRGTVDTDFLFVTIDGTQLGARTYQEDIKDAVTDCGIQKQITSHSLRRTYAKMAVLSGIDPFSLAKLMGHADLSTTAKYVQIWGTDLKKQSKKRGTTKGLF